MRTLLLASVLFLAPACEPDRKPAAPSLNLTHSTSFVVYPADTQHHGTLFGGKILAEMDRCAGIVTRRLLWASPTGARDAVTVSVESVTFRKAGEVKDLIHVRGTVIGLGTKSIRIKVEVVRETETGCELLADGVFVYVAYDRTAKKAVEHGLKLP